MDFLKFLNCTKIVILLTLCLGSCASKAAVRENPLSVYLTDNSNFILLSPAGIENPMDMAQYISASYGGQEYLLNAWVQADETGMGMTLLNELGVNMGELSYRNGAVSFSSSVFPKNLKSEYIIADFQLCFYKETPLRQALNDCGLSFEQTEKGRRVLSKETVVIEIEKSPGSVRLINHLRGYTYTLEGEFQ